MEVDPRQIFNEVLKTVENSNLNYTINKTPFSAMISIKSSFIKRFSEYSQYKMAKDDNILKTEVKSEKEHNLKIKEDLANLNAASVKDHEAFYAEKKRLESVLEKEAIKNKSLEKQISDMREEALKLKSDKNQLKIKMKDLEASLLSAGSEMTSLKKENEARLSKTKYLH